MYSTGMVTVRPTIKVLKRLANAGKLPGSVKDLYRAVKATDEPTIQVERLRELVEVAQKQVTLLTYIQSRFDQGIFERYRGRFVPPVFESRDAERPAWRGAVVHPSGDYAWLVYVNTHDHFHSEAKGALQSMQKNGTLGPSVLDQRVLTQQLELNKKREFARNAIRDTLDALRRATAQRKPSLFFLDNLKVKIEIETENFEKWQVESAHGELDFLTIVLDNWQAESEAANLYLNALLPALPAGREAIEQVYDPIGKRLLLQILLSRADLISLVNSPEGDYPMHKRVQPEPDLLHYSPKDALTEALVTGRPTRAVCGKWWVPVGDDSTHGHLPICSECEKLEPVAQALRSSVQSRQNQNVRK